MTERRLFTPEEKMLALERQGYVCPACGKGFGMEGQGHHMCQNWQGGATTVDNLMVLHKGRCHEIFDAQATLYGNIYTLGHLSLAEDSQIVDKSKQAQACIRISDLNSTLERRIANQERMSRILRK